MLRIALTCVLFGISFFGLSSGNFLTLQQSVELNEQRFEKSPRNLKILLQLVDSYNLNSQYVKAEKVIRNYSRKINRNDRKTKAALYLALAQSYKFQNDNDLAAYYFLLAKDCYEKIKDFTGLVKCGVEIIEFNRRLAKFSKAEKAYYYYSFIAKSHPNLDPVIRNGLYNRYAAVLNETGRPNTSIRFSKKALEIAEKNQDQNAQAISYNEIGFSYKNLNHHDDAIENYKKAEVLWMKMGYFRDAVHARLNRISVLTHDEMISKLQTEKELLEVLRIIEKHQIDYPKSFIYRDLKTVYHDQRNYLKAYQISELYIRNLELEFINKRNSDIENIQEKYNNGKLEKEKGAYIKDVKTKRRELIKTRLNLLSSIVILIIILAALIGLFYLWRKLRIANKLLVKRNHQKTVLVQEIHHRVKNNLQFVRSMLEMEIGLKTSAQDAQSLNDVMRRMDAMSLVHEMLYIEDESMGVSLKSYIEKLVQVSRVFYHESAEVQLELKVEEMQLPIDKVVSLGIICSELLSNSVKHSYQETERREFHISVKKKDQYYLMNVWDNGTENSEISQSKRYGLGMRMIDIFSRQLNGAYTITKENGYHYEMKFKI